MSAYEEEGAIQRDGWTRRHAGARNEFLIRASVAAAEMAKRAGRRRAYELAGLEDSATDSPVQPVDLASERRKRKGVERG